MLRRKLTPNRILTSKHCFLVFLFLAPWNQVCNAQAGFKQIGTGTDGQVAFEYMGVVKQTGPEFVANGFFTYIHGVPDDALFFRGAARDENHARFTFHSKSKMVHRSVVNKVFNVSVKGGMDIYVRPKSVAKASMENDQDFIVGQRIATLDMRGQSVVVVDAPGQGTNSAMLELVQTKTAWKVFSIGDEAFTFGSPGTPFRLSHIGRGKQDQQSPIVATITIAGHAFSKSRSEK